MSHFSAARVIKTFVFVTIIFGIYALLHVALVAYLAARFGWEIGWLFWVLGVFSVLTFVISHGRHHRITAALYLVGMLWMGFVIISNLVLLPVWLASLVNIPIPYWAVFGTALLLCIGGFFAATRPRLKTITLPLRELTKPVTIVQISDTHIGEIYGPNYLAKLVALTNARHPDVVVITGDLFDGGGILYPGEIAPLRDLKAPVLFITGNHEVYEGVYPTTKLVREHGATVLDDQITTLAGIQFVGVSYPLDFGDDKHRTIVKLAKKVDRKKPIVLLRHEPKRLDDAVYLGADLVLAGHTHNGQIFPFNIVAKLFYEHVSGLHIKEHTTIYVTPGAATWGPPFRIGSRSEITEFRLVPPRRKQ